jgi:poly [ADP-ribose] polymerase 2/3/4
VCIGRQSYRTNLQNLQQVAFDSESEKYTLVTREGRVGLMGEAKLEMTSTDLKTVTAAFRRIFRSKTNLVWTRRYETCSYRDSVFTFVELDYRRTLSQHLEPPNYAIIDAKVNKEVRDLMEYILYGGPMQARNDREPPLTSSSRLTFTAPSYQLSSWSIFSAFKTLDRVCKQLESGNPIHWKAILRVSSRYRSQIPFCAGEDRPPVISSYHAIFLELKYLHSLWSWQEIASKLTEIHHRGSLQVKAYMEIAQPLYQAYSSLRHGFRRLTDASTLEFRELKNYLENSCHRIHHLTLELQEIYQIFVKANLPNPYRDWIQSRQGFGSYDEERLLLWHGTPLDSVMGILDLGLQIRRRGASWTGTMFGNGIYFADASSKSAGFCKHRLWNEEAVLLLCEVDVGAFRIRSKVSMGQGHSVIEQSCGLHRCIEGLGTTGPGKWTKVGWEMRGEPSMAKGVVMMVRKFKDRVS